MNAGAIWWGQIGNSLRLLSQVSDSLRDCRSAVLQVPREFPWRREFYEAVDIRRTAFSGQRRLRRLAWEENGDPGEFVLDELCSARVKADYWPGQSCAEYLGSKEDLLLNDYDVWVTGIHSKTDLTKWTEFAAQYRRAAQQLESRGTFILEYDGVPLDASGVETIRYTVENYDCRVFALEAAAALANTGLRNYQAELAVSISGNDPEFCFALLMTGERLLRDPIQTTRNICAGACSSQGLSFQKMREQQIHSAAWEAAVVRLFPVLERCRMDFISKNEGRLANHLPISNSNGDQVTEPCDLELGALYYIVSSSGKEFSPEEAEIIRLCRKVRNLLAHNKLVPYEEIQKVLKL